MELIGVTDKGAWKYYCNSCHTIIEVFKNDQDGVIGGIGGFGGLFSLDKYKMNDPVLVSSTDGVGTKLKLAFIMDAHNTVGIDLVAMVVNDIIVQGAKPLFFLDYIAISKLEVYTVSEIINGITLGCRQADCALLGGETAELPDFYKKGEYDLSGFAVGIVERDKIIDGSKIRPGDKLIGISSSGLHSNGFSLVRKICFDILNLNVDEYIPEFGKGLGEELLTPTKIYVDTVNNINKEFPILGMAHITGGGLADNILRAIPDSCGIEIKKHNWFVPPVFTFLQQAGNISEKEMMRVFNNGIGMVLIIQSEIEQDVLEKLDEMGEKSYSLGTVTKRSSAEERAKFV
jgi:phosphoribosylformylglycinamidine cyclo-ligase